MMSKTFQTEFTIRRLHWLTLNVVGYIIYIYTYVYVCVGQWEKKGDSNVEEDI